MKVARTLIPYLKKIELWPISKFIFYVNNPRIHEDKIEKFARLIRHFGFWAPVLANKQHEVVDGHFRIKAAQRLGMTELPVALVEGLTPMQIKAFRIAVNRIAEEADWDGTALIGELEDLRDTYSDVSALADMTGFEPGEIDDFMADEPDADDVEDDGLPKKLGTKHETDLLAPGDDADSLEDQSPIMSFRDDVIFDQIGVQGLPTIRKDMLLDCDPVPVAWAGPQYSAEDVTAYMYSYMTETTVGLDWPKTIIGFYTADKKFERLWTHTAEITTRFRNVKIKGLVTPDYSVFHGWPLALRGYNIYRSRWVGRYMQEAGIKIAVNVSGTEPDMAYAFDGLPGGCPMSMQLQGKMTKDEVKRETEIIRAVLEFRPRFLWVYATHDKIEMFPILRQKKVRVEWITPRMVVRRQEFDRRRQHG